MSNESPPFKECLGCSSPHRCEALQYCPIKDAVGEATRSTAPSQRGESNVSAPASPPSEPPPREHDYCREFGCYMNHASPPHAAFGPEATARMNRHLTKLEADVESNFGLKESPPHAAVKGRIRVGEFNCECPECGMHWSRFDSTESHEPGCRNAPPVAAAEPDAEAECPGCGKDGHADTMAIYVCDHCDRWWERKDAAAEPEKPELSIAEMDVIGDVAQAWAHRPVRQAQELYLAGKRASPSAQPDTRKALEVLVAAIKPINPDAPESNEVEAVISKAAIIYANFVLSRTASSAQPIAREPPPDDSQLASDVAYLRAKNDPRLFDIANQLIYCWSQDGLLSKAQAERDKLRDELAETKRPLDDQMRRLNERVIELNDENLALKRLKSAGKES